MKYLRSSGKPKKCIRDCAEEEPAPKKERKEFFQYPTVAQVPPIPVGEDEHSNKRNQKMLLSEEKKINPNKQTISILMERTFAFRRKDLTDCAYPIAEILKIYPSLRRIDQVESLFNACYDIWNIYM